MSVNRTRYGKCSLAPRGSLCMIISRSGQATSPPRFRSTCYVRRQKSRCNFPVLAGVITSSIDESRCFAGLRRSF